MKDAYFVHPTAIVDDGARIGNGTKIWHFSHLMPECRVGEDCVLGQNVFIDNGVVIGNGVKIQNNVSIYNGVVIEEGAFVGPSVVFTNVTNPRSFIDRKDEFKQTIVRGGASIGANATIICGTELGRFSFVGAGSVVTKDVKAFALVFGCPSVQHGWVSKNAYRLIFNDNSEASCPFSHHKYFLKDDEVDFL